MIFPAIVRILICVCLVVCGRCQEAEKVSSYDTYNDIIYTAANEYVYNAEEETINASTEDRVWNAALCNCSGGYCEEKSNGTVCMCPPGYGPVISKGLPVTKCMECNCGEGSNCTFNYDRFWDIKHCVCKEGYTEVKVGNGTNVCKINKENPVCVDRRILEECRRKTATCVADTASERGFRCVCDVGYLEKNGVCTKRTACDDVRAIEKCHRKSATCAVDEMSVEGRGFKCICDAGYFDKDGVCTEDDRSQKILSVVLLSNLIVSAIFLLFMLCGGFFVFRMHQKLKVALAPRSDRK